MNKTAFTFGPAMLDISCGKCGQQSDADGWTVDRFGFERPTNHFQCPACGHAFKIVKTKEAWLRNQLVPIPATL